MNQMDDRYTFTELFSKPVDIDKENKGTLSSIIIPKIQRPYAQGRNNAACHYIRTKLLTDMFETLSQNELFELNFIYGIVRKTNDKYVMELLDGQQRLTTLFLLHWYVANRELKDTPRSEELRRLLLGFVYETRYTSTIFCQKLARFYVDLDSITPSEAIQNAKWYFSSFDKDSTVEGMLTMLDAIHEKYNQSGLTDLHTKLDKIKFYVKSLGYFNLSEELYIKMNARGLQLTAFENFKADLTNYVSSRKNVGYNQQVQLFSSVTSHQVRFDFSFSVKIDAKWIDIFWTDTNRNFDAAYLSFFTRFFAYKYIIGSKEEVSDRDMRANQTLKFFYTDEEEGRNHVTRYLGFKVFETLLDRHPEYIQSLDKVLDVFYDHRDLISHELVPRWNKKRHQSDDFFKNLNSKITHEKFIAFAAVCEFADAYPAFKETDFKDWMRVVWNVIENTNIDGLTPVSSLIRKFSSLIRFVAKHCIENGSFYAALARFGEENSSGQENRALVEEIRKAKLISVNSAWKNTFVEIESHPFFKGMVGFFHTDGMSLDNYKHRCELVSQMFDKDGISAEFRKDHLLIRAFISCFTSWDHDLNERYITERSENHKYLKNMLAAHKGIRTMICDVLDCENINKACIALNGYISEPRSITPWSDARPSDIEAINMAVHKLKNHIQLYDWMAKKEYEKKACFRIYFFEGHITIAIPYNNVYARLFLDTERVSVADYLYNRYGFKYEDKKQEQMYREYGDCFGKELCMYQERNNCTVWVSFKSNHSTSIALTCDTTSYANDLGTRFKGSSVEGKTVRLPLPQFMCMKKEEACDRLTIELNRIIEIIPALPNVAENS